MWSQGQPHPGDPLMPSSPLPEGSVFYQVKQMFGSPLLTHHPPPPGHRAYLQLAIPFTFTQMPSFWQGFGSHGSRKYCGQLWSSRGPVFSTDRFCRPGCPWSRLLGSAFSNKTFPEPSSEACCSWSWRMRPWGISLVSRVGISVWLR